MTISGSSFANLWLSFSFLFYSLLLPVRIHISIQSGKTTKCLKHKSKEWYREAKKCLSSEIERVMAGLSGKRHKADTNTSMIGEKQDRMNDLPIPGFSCCQS
jgi:hypothetical protein